MSRTFKEGLGDGEKMVEKRTNSKLKVAKDRREGKLQQKRKVTSDVGWDFEKLCAEFKKTKDPLIFAEILVQGGKAETFINENADYIRLCLKNVAKNHNIIGIAANLAFREDDDQYTNYIKMLVDADFIKKCANILINTDSQVTKNKVIIFFSNMCMESAAIRNKICSYPYLLYLTSAIVKGEPNMGHAFYSLFHCSGINGSGLPKFESICQIFRAGVEYFLSLKELNCDLVYYSKAFNCMATSPTYRSVLINEKKLLSVLVYTCNTYNIEYVTRFFGLLCEDTANHDKLTAAVQFFGIAIRKSEGLDPIATMDVISFALIGLEHLSKNPKMHSNFVASNMVDVLEDLLTLSNIANFRHYVCFIYCALIRMCSTNHVHIWLKDRRYLARLCKTLSQGQTSSESLILNILHSINRLAQYGKRKTVLNIIDEEDCYDKLDTMATTADPYHGTDVLAAKIIDRINSAIDIDSDDEENDVYG